MPAELSFSPSHENPDASNHLIFFVPGNPGLISYYDAFLRTLHQLLSEKKSEADVFHIHGQSLNGFEENSTPSQATGLPYSLEEQIESRLQCLKDRSIVSGGPRQGQAYDSIILVGHSVGSYIVLEMLQRLRQTPSLNVKAGILLFPTVTHIAQSPSGVKLSTLFRIPGFAWGASLAAKALIWPLPKPVLKRLVRLVTGMPGEATDVTTRFLRSRMGVWQAL
jgi:pimeloyl-ACP methyl ester carboxylesterase